MIKRKRTLLSIWLIVSALALLTGCTTSAFGPPSLATQVRSAVSSGYVGVYLDGATAVLSGRVDSLYDRNSAVSAAKRYPGVEQVVSRISVIDTN